MVGLENLFFNETSKRNVDVQIKSYFFSVMEDYTSYTYTYTSYIIASELIQHTL